MKHDKNLIIVGAFFIIITNSLTYFLTNLVVSANTEYEFHRAAILAEVAEYDEFLDWKFKSLEKITFEYLLKRSQDKDQEIEIKPSLKAEKFYAEN